MDYDDDKLPEPLRILMRAITLGRADKIPLIVNEYKIDPDIVLPPEENRPIHIAAQISGPPVLTALKDVGANLFATNRWGQTALYAAIEGSNLPAIDFFAEHKANFNITDNLTISPLESAEIIQNQAVIARLEYYGARKPDRSDRLLFLPEPQKIITKPPSPQAEDPFISPDSPLRWIEARKRQGPDNSPPRPGG